MVRYEWTDWKPITKCVSNSCMIPAKGIRIVARSCTSHTTNGSEESNSDVEPNASTKICSGVQRSVQVCTSTNILEDCSKLMTPSEFASYNCAKYQVKVFFASVFDF